MRRKKFPHFCESPIEVKLYLAMLDYGLLPICQYQIDYYRVDFAFIPEKLIVEADGRYWHRGWRKKCDSKRDEYLQSKGWKVLRFSGRNIHNNADLCARIVRRWLKDAK